MTLCTEVASISSLGTWASAIALVGSLALTYSAWRASRIYLKAHQLSRRLPADDAHGEIVNTFSKVLTTHANGWSLFMHRMLMMGVFMMVLSGLMNLLKEFCL